MKMPSTRLRLQCFLPMVAGLAALSGCGGSDGADRTSRAIDVVQSALVTADCEANPEACCPAGTTVVRLTSHDDNYSNAASKRCSLGRAGRDTISSLGAPAVAVFSGADDEVVSTGPGNDTIRGG